MSGTGGGRSPSFQDHAYFRAIEETFIRLRGAPMLLSPADWQVARQWHREGIPLELVENTMEEVFARRRARGTKGRIQSLRYCAPAVRAAWEEVCELTASGARREAPALDVAARLESLARHLPAALPDREGLAARVRAVAGDVETVEQELSALDRQILEDAQRALDAQTREGLEGGVDRTLASLAERLPQAELREARQRLLLQAVRRRLGLPVLSLFSPEAEKGDASANRE